VRKSSGIRVAFGYNSGKILSLREKALFEDKGNKTDSDYGCVEYDGQFGIRD
jgi:hypothetical protein